MKLDRTMKEDPMCGDTTRARHADAPATRPRGDEEDEALRAGGDPRCAA
ncbi:MULTISPECIES: hypothetical protein [unclassified Streptomyces]